MKLLIVGSKKKFALESFYKNHIQNMGYDAEIFPSSDIFHNYYEKSLLNKIIFRLGISGIYKKINSELFDFIKVNRPSTVLIFKGMEVFPSTVDVLKKMNIFIANYNPDHPFYFHGKGSGNKNVTLSLNKYDLHFTYNLKVKSIIENKLKLPCCWVPFGFEPTNIPLPTEYDEIKRVCFIGFADKERAMVIKQIVNLKIPIDVYGPNWSNFLKESKYLTIGDAVYNNDFNSTALKYRVQLNLFRPHNNDSHNMRSFEMPGIGCIMLAPNSVEHRLFYENGKEVFLYDSIDQLLEQIKHLLHMPYKNALEIRKNAVARSINSKYSYADRTEQLMNFLGQYIKN